MTEKHWVVVFICSVAFSCEKGPSERIPVEPFIAFESLTFIETDELSQADTLKLKFFLQDGDSDFGLDISQQDNPYHYLDYYLKDSGNPVSDIEVKQTNLNPELLISYKDRVDPPFDTLPPFTSPFSCINWQIVYDEQYKLIDTLFFRFNKYHYNLLVDFYTVNPDESLSLFDWSSEFSFPGCVSTYNARAPFFPKVLNKPDREGPFQITAFSNKEATITYNMLSTGFKFLFGNRKIVLKVRAIDQALNISNEIQTTKIQF